MTSANGLKQRRERSKHVGKEIIVLTRKKVGCSLYGKGHRAEYFHGSLLHTLVPKKLEIYSALKKTLFARVPGQKCLHSVAIC